MRAGGGFSAGAVVALLSARDGTSGRGGPRSRQFAATPGGSGGRAVVCGPGQRGAFSGGRFCRTGACGGEVLSASREPDLSRAGSFRAGGGSSCRGSPDCGIRTEDGRSADTAVRGTGGDNSRMLGRKRAACGSFWQYSDELRLGAVSGGGRSSVRSGDRHLSGNPLPPQLCRFRNRGSFCDWRKLGI